MYFYFFIAIKGCQTPFSQTLIQQIPGLSPTDQECFENIDTEWNNCMGSTCSGDLAGIIRFLTNTAPDICAGQGLNFITFWLDSMGGAKVCQISQDNKICQQYPANLCDSLCADQCSDTNLITGSLPLSDPCKLGECYDAGEETCQSNSPRKKCRDFGGNWDLEGEQPACVRGCCVMKGNSLLTTSKQCEKKGDFLGLRMDNGIVFDDVVTIHDECKALKIGACTSIIDGEEECEITTNRKCADEIGGSFEEETPCPQGGIIQRVTFNLNKRVG